MSSPAFRFRLATLDDAPALLSIYAPYVEKTAISFEYDVPSLDEFRRRIADISRKYPYLVAEDENGQFLGYAYTHTFIARKAYDHCAESTIYLALDARKHGLGKRFYRAIEELSLAQNIPSRSSTRRLSPTFFAALRNKEPKFYKKSCTPY